MTRCAVSIALAYFLVLPLFAQSAHSRLKDQTLLKRFDAISHKIMCTCGCNMPLRNCNHTGHCNAWPARDAIDKLLLAGYTDTQIIDGFKNGFGKIAETDAAFTLARTQDYNYMVPKFENGFGSQILSIPESNYLAVFSILGFLLSAGVVVLFIRHRRKNQKAEPSLEGGEGLDARKRDELLKQISRDV